MNLVKERILVVISDPVISDLVNRQTLQPMGFQVQVSSSATLAIPVVPRFNPDLIIADLNLPDLSGKDLLVALNAQGLDVPIVVIADEGHKNDVIQAFRLGAADFILWPAREAEVLSAVDRVLKLGRTRKEKELLSRQLNQTNQELQRRVRELTTIFAIGKAVISITDLHEVFEKIVEGAVLVTDAEAGWLLTRAERGRSYILSAQRNLPKSVTAYLNRPWDDGVSSLVALSGEPLVIHGEPLKRFKTYALGQSALVVPVKVKKEVVGLLAVVRKTANQFSPSCQALLEAVADYASIALVNARLFRVLDERARTAQQAVEVARVSELLNEHLIAAAGKELNTVVQFLQVELTDIKGSLNSRQQVDIQLFLERMDMVGDIAQFLTSYTEDETARFRNHPDLNELVRFSVKRFKNLAQKAAVTLFTQFSLRPIHLEAQGVHILQVIDGLLSNAIRFSPNKSQVSLGVDSLPENLAHLSVRDAGPGIDEMGLQKIFETRSYSKKPSSRQFTGLGIDLPTARQVVLSYGGQLWAESTPGNGSTFHLSLPLVK